MYRFKDVLLTGFALFAMLFGAGNLIFPPMLGYEVNSSWFLTISAFIITAVGLPLLGILSVSIAGNGLDDFAKKVSPLFAKVFAIVLILAIGPMLAIPRTGATAYEITFLYKGLTSSIYKYLYLSAYFLIVTYFSLRANKVVERVGKILTPVLLLVLVVILIKGIFFTDLDIKNIVYPNAFKKGFLEGYQTMDTLASIAYATIILKAIKNGRELNRKSELSFLIKSSLIAVVSLAIVYMGFTFIGAKMYSVLNVESKTQLLVDMTTYLLGDYGYLLLAICVAGACLTTAIGLVATVADYFSNLLKIEYNKIVFFTVIISFLLSILGVEGIIKISVPILVFIYPITMSLIVLNLFKNFIKNDMLFKLTIMFTSLIGLIEALLSMEIQKEFLSNFLNVLPLSEYGLTFLFPAIFGLILAKIIFKVKEIKN